MNKPVTLSAAYTHHEGHGPGIYHNELLAKYSSHLDIHHANIMETTWEFPENVDVIPDRDYVKTWDEIYAHNAVVKWLYFLKYVWIILKNVRKKKHDILVFINPPALLAFRIIRIFVPKKSKVWYHNYDPIDENNVKKYSQQWFAIKAMHKMFPVIDLFTHSEEKRDVFFPMEKLKRPRKILPNYPAIEMHGGKPRLLGPNEPLKLIFSGVISAGNSLEELILLVKNPVAGREVNLILKGFIKDDYKQSLIELIKTTGVENKVKFIAAGPWKEVPELLRTAHVGIHIFNKADEISKRMGKGGSGKVFQYIAEGLPVMMSTGFKNNFQEYDWAVATMLDQDSLRDNVKGIINEYNSLSQKAIESFKTELSCNNQFHEIFSSLIEE